MAEGSPHVVGRQRGSFRRQRIVASAVFVTVVVVGGLVALGLAGRGDRAGTMAGLPMPTIERAQVRGSSWFASGAVRVVVTEPSSPAGVDRLEVSVEAQTKCATYPGELRTYTWNEVQPIFSVTTQKILRREALWSPGTAVLVCFDVDYVIRVRFLDAAGAGGLWSEPWTTKAASNI